MQRMIFALILSLALVLVAGPRVIAELKKLKFGQTIYELMPASHKAKQGTPTMGGLLMAGAVVIACLVCHPAQWQGGWDFMLALLAVSVLSMLVGFADDFIKVVKKRSLGLTPWQKIAGQVLVSVGFTVYCYLHPQVGSSIFVPFFNVEWDLGVWYIPLLSLTVMFMINSANLQDGLDGLLSSVTAVGSTAWGVMALMFMLAVGAVDEAYTGNLASAAVFAMAVTGAAIGFLRFNHYPATVFMGDTGSMFIGGATVGLAMLMRQPMLLLLIAFTMVMSSVSVILQRYYYKATRKIYGKPRRIFKSSPLHLHFQLCGMSENQIVAMYAAVTGVLSLIAILSLNGLPLVK